LPTIGAGTLNSLFLVRFFLNAVDLERILAISVKDLPSLRAATASVSALYCALVFGYSFSKCYSD
jgi:hypothetical protein